MTTFLVVDVGTSALRAALVDETLSIRAMEFRPCPPSSPFPGLVEFDASEMAELVLDAVDTVIDRAGAAVDAVGVTNQRASIVAWDRSTGDPIGPGIGWQDLRTVGDCLTARAERGWALAPNQSVTKVSWLLANTPGARDRDVCVGTVDSWVTWALSGGNTHVSDQTNASATTSGMRVPDGSGWRSEVLDHFDVPAEVLPSVVDTVGVAAVAAAVPGAPPIAALVGDQQASLVGQGCVRPGQAKITFGTGGMFDACTGATTPTSTNRLPSGTYPLPVWSRHGELTWGVEGIILSAGTNVDWLRDDLGVIATSAESHEVAATCADTGGVVYVPALLGLGTPAWDYGARGTLIGLTRGTGRAEVVRAVLEGVAHRGADLVEAAVADTALDMDTVRIDGGMSRNPTFVQALADATGLPVEVAPTVEATTLGAAFLSGLAIGTWTSMDDADRLWDPVDVVEPDATVDRAATRARWADAVDRAKGWIPELSALDV